MGAILINLAFLGAGVNLIVELIMLGIIIIGSIIGAIISKKRSEKFNTRVLDILAIIIMLMYLIDLIMPIFIGKIYASRVPFTIGTVLAPLIIISRFVTPFDKYKSTVAMLSIIALFVYLLYPNPSLALEDFKFRNVQVFTYFGLGLCYGAISIASGEVRLNIKKSYQTAICLGLIEIWALILKYLFISIPGDMEDIKLISPIIGATKYVILPSIAIVVVSFLMCLLVYLIYLLINRLHKKYKGIRR